MQPTVKITLNSTDNNTGTLLTLFNSVLRLTLNVCLTTVSVTLTKRLKSTQYKQTWNQDVFTHYLKYIKQEILDAPYIVSSNSHPTERTSQVYYHINPLVSTLDSHIEDTTDFLNKLSNLGNLPNNAILITLDVSSLYTNIPHNQGIDACLHFLDTRPNKHIPTETLCDLLAWFSPWIISHLTNSIIFKSMNCYGY